jgi:hypothetical protein
MTMKAENYTILVELFLPSEVLKGYVSISNKMRLLDLLNRAGSADSDAFSGYIELLPARDTGDTGPRQYVRKTSIELAAVLEPDNARGFGGKIKTYPVVEKVPIHINMNTRNFNLSGTVQFAQGSSLLSLIDETTAFLPMVNATLSGKGASSLVRPFVAVGKAWISTLKEQRSALAA